MKITREDINDLKIFYGIDVEEEISRILAEEIEKSLKINEENLKNDGWEFGKCLTTGKGI